ncbi:PAS/PAC sensor hybrid histidine kinase [Caballeronia catudaia]|uniref:histidine kinase n=1 Tax=Caballeronia catudaia TaxID=1777136 RepID=A0A158DKX4_9BURK|nr:ATP-binding protein [Caballeronia catudaia]SAK94856.1 PAS/PAC sensor hybrid histidine kinase [Caballeronia catudaia]
MQEPLRSVSDFKAAYERAPCGLFTAKAGGKIVQVNRTFCEWLGFPASELVGQRTFLDLLTTGGKIFLQTHLAPLLQVQRSVAEVKLDMRRRDGAVVPMMVNVCRVTEGGIALDEFAVMVMGDRHKYERELVAARGRSDEALKGKETAELALKLADRRKDEFLATLAHELRNPFSAMRSAIDLLSRQQPLTADALWPLEMLDRQLAQAARLADDLLDVSRIGEGKIEIKKMPVEIGAIIREVVESTRARQAACESSHDFDVHLPHGRIQLLADPVRLAQIVQNLLNNAFRYTPSGGKIVLSATRHGDNVVMSVRDTGIGISQEDLTTIFTMFAQAPSGHGRSKGGLGIGLALVRALVQLHDGQLTAASQGPGKGSEFEVRLPALPAGDSSLAAAMTSPAANQTLSAPAEERRVLVVDDSEDAAASLALLLQAEGHEVETANCGLDALRVEAAFHPEAVILDLGLPDIDGKEVAAKIRSRRGSRVTLIALTGWQADAAVKPDAQLEPDESPFDAYFVKPANVDELLAELRGIKKSAVDPPT